MPVEVLGGLVLTQVGVDAGCPAALHEVAGDQLGRPHQFQEQVVVRLLQGDEGFDVLFGEQHDMVLPDGIRMVKGEDMLVLEVNRDIQQPFQNLVAIEVAGWVGHFTNSLMVSEVVGKPGSLSSVFTVAIHVDVLPDIREPARCLDR